MTILKYQIINRIDKKSLGRIPIGTRSSQIIQPRKGKGSYRRKHKNERDTIKE